jgi:hypothetical protein
MQEFTSGMMRCRLLVKLHFESGERLVELFRFHHGPRNNLQLSRVKMSDEVSILLILDYLLEFERESKCF